MRLDFQYPMLCYARCIRIHTCYARPQTQKGKDLKRKKETNTETERYEEWIIKLVDRGCQENNEIWNTIKFLRNDLTRFTAGEAGL